MMRGHFDQGAFDFRTADGIVETYVDEHNVLRNLFTPPRPDHVREVFRLRLGAPLDEDAEWDQGVILAAEFMGYQPVSSIPEDELD